MKDQTIVDITFKKKFNELIKLNNLTQKDAADGIGITRQAVSLYTTGQRTPDINTLYKICGYFEVSADYLLGIAEQRTSDIDEKKISEITGLSDKAIRRLKSYKKYLPGVLIPALNELIEYEQDGKLLATFKDYSEFSTLSSKEKEDLINDLYQKKSSNDGENKSIYEETELPDFLEGPLLVIDQYLNSLVANEGCLNVSLTDRHVGRIETQQIIDTVIIDDLKEVLNHMRKKYNGRKEKAKIRYKEYTNDWDVVRRNMVLQNIKFDDFYDESKPLFEKMIFNLINMADNENANADKGAGFIEEFLDEFFKTIKKMR
ncbi:helix-turn-helix transcriptional regulator [Eubacteriaceae bacterium ES3]|nr:helix-turn-helix transcriptional regulator [Eubacteriaceae bacterium ES3]